MDTPNTQIRKIIASRLLESKVTIPHTYFTRDASLSALNELRKGLAERGVKVSVNDFVLKAVANALKEVPAANVAWDPKAQEAVAFKGVDICVAVATERGLITPIVKDAEKKTLQQISKDVRDLALRARDNKLKPEEFMGGSFTVSNLGMFGVAQFCAIINPPQAAILAVGGAQSKVSLEGGRPVERQYMSLTLSCDQRVYDAELAGSLLKALVAGIESPVALVGGL